MKSWVSYLMNASIDFASTEDLPEVVDLIESTPYGLIETVFDGCTTVGQVIDRALEILDELEEYGFFDGNGAHFERAELLEPDDDPDWIIPDEIDEE